jgi:hypothetical protein
MGLRNEALFRAVLNGRLSSGVEILHICGNHRCKVPEHRILRTISKNEFWRSAIVKASVNVGSTSNALPRIRVARKSCCWTTRNAALE